MATTFRNYTQAEVRAQLYALVLSPLELVALGDDEHVEYHRPEPGRDYRLQHFDNKDKLPLLTALMNILQLFYSPAGYYRITPDINRSLEDMLCHGHHFEHLHFPPRLTHLAPRLTYTHVSRACMVVALIMAGYKYKFSRGYDGSFQFRGHYERHPTSQQCQAYLYSQGLQEGGFFSVARYFTHRCVPLKEIKPVLKRLGHVRQLAWGCLLWQALPLELQELVMCHLGDDVPAVPKKRKHMLV